MVAPTLSNDKPKPKPFDQAQAVDALKRRLEVFRHALPAEARDDFPGLVRAAMAGLRQDDRAAARHAKKNGGVA